jgi:site-specific DNA-methyltransferase (adenine-specific)
MKGMGMINKIYNENCLDTMKRMPDNFIDLVVTSPPYWNLRDYDNDEQIGLEQTFQEYLDNIFNIFQLLHVKIKDTGAAWVNLGDTYSTVSGTMGTGRGDPKHVEKTNEGLNFKQIKTSFKDKTLLAIPDRFKIMMIDAGWICRNDIIWHKPNAMPSSAADRFTVDYERFLFFVKQSRGYYFKTQRTPHKKTSLERVKRNWNGNLCKGHALSGLKNGDMSKMCHPDGRNKRTVWSINTKPNSNAHFASYPEQLIETPIKACSPENGLVYDPFIGSGTTAIVAIKNNRNYIGSEISKEYCDIADKRIKEELSQGDFFRTMNYKEPPCKQ